VVLTGNLSIKKGNAMCELIDKQPTAYDVDKVVEQLDDYLFEKYCVEGDNEVERIVRVGGI